MQYIYSYKDIINNVLIIPRLFYKIINNNALSFWYVLEDDILS